jgi:hypothetical protein
MDIGRNFDIRDILRWINLQYIGDRRAYRQYYQGLNQEADFVAGRSVCAQTVFSVQQFDENDCGLLRRGGRR